MGQLMLATRLLSCAESELVLNVSDYACGMLAC